MGPPVAGGRQVVHWAISVEAAVVQVEGEICLYQPCHALAAFPARLERMCWLFTMPCFAPLLAPHAAVDYWTASGDGRSPLGVLALSCCEQEILR